MATLTKSKGQALTDKAIDADLADHACDVMQGMCPSWSIDKLLTHPHRAIEMASEVCRRLGRRASRDNVHKVCRAALNARKHGGLKRDRF